jgi:hypothetical protein
MHLLGGLFSGSNEGIESALAPKRRLDPRTTPKPSLFTHLNVREEELWAGDDRLFPVPLTVHGDGI